MALANSAAGAESARAGYIPPFRPLPSVGEGPVEALHASTGAAVGSGGGWLPDENSEEPQDAQGREDAPPEYNSRWMGPPDARFRAPSEAFAALIEFAGMLGGEFGGGAFNDASRAQKAVSTYERIEQIIRGVFYRPGGTLSISL